MTKPHQLAFYMDGYFKVDFCKVCGAEDLLLADGCSEKIVIHDPKFDLTDNKKRLSKNYWNKGMVPNYKKEI